MDLAITSLLWGRFKILMMMMAEVPVSSIGTTLQC